MAGPGGNNNKAQAQPQRELGPEVDLAQLAKKPGYSVSIETQETEEDAAHRRWKDKVIFLCGIGGLILVFGVCLWVLGFGPQPPEEKKIWAGVLISLISGFLGYSLKK